MTADQKNIHQGSIPERFASFDTSLLYSNIFWSYKFNKTTDFEIVYYFGQTL